ncbi:hypothetical protein ACXHXM_34020
MKYDLAKTQFLIDKGACGTYRRTFRRKRGLMLFDKSGDIIRPITQKDWDELRKAWPEEVKQDGLKVKSVWFLEEIVK